MLLSRHFPPSLHLRLVLTCPFIYLRAPNFKLRHEHDTVRQFVYLFHIYHNDIVLQKHLHETQMTVVTFYVVLFVKTNVERLHHWQGFTNRQLITPSNSSNTLDLSPKYRNIISCASNSSPSTVHDPINHASVSNAYTQNSTCSSPHTAYLSTAYKKDKQSISRSDYRTPTPAWKLMTIRFNVTTKKTKPKSKFVKQFVYCTAALWINLFHTFIQSIDRHPWKKTTMKW